MVSTRGNPVADGRKSTLPSRESRRSTRGALQEPEDELFWDSEDQGSRSQKRAKRVNVTFKDTTSPRSASSRSPGCKEDAVMKAKGGSSSQQLGAIHLKQSEESNKAALRKLRTRTLAVLLSRSLADKKLKTWARKRPPCFSCEEAPRPQTSRDTSRPRPSRRRRDELAAIEGDTDTDDEIFNRVQTRRTRGERRKEKSPIKKEFVMNGDDIDNSHMEVSEGLRRSSRRNTYSNQSWLVGSKKLRGYPTMVASSEPENEEPRPSRKMRKYIDSEGDNDDEGTRARSRFHSGNIESRRKRSRKYTETSEQEFCSVGPRTRQPNRRLRVPKSDQSDDETDISRSRRPLSLRRYRDDDNSEEETGRRMVTRHAAQVKLASEEEEDEEAEGEGKIDEGDEDEKSEVPDKVKLRFKDGKGEEVNGEDEEEEKNQDDDDDEMPQMRRTTRSSIEAGRGKIEDTEEEEEEEEEEEPPPVRPARQPRKYGPQDPIIARALASKVPFEDLYPRVKRERRPVKRFMYEEEEEVVRNRRIRKRVSSSDDSDNDKDEDEEDEDEDEEEENEEQNGNRYSLRQNRREIRPFQLSAVEKTSRSSRSYREDTPPRRHHRNHKRYVNSPARKHIFHHKRRTFLPQAAHAHNSSSSSSSSDESHFEKTKQRSMAKSRSRCLPMNMKPEDMITGALKDREKIGSSLADIDPMLVDRQVNFDSVGGLAHHVKALKEMIIFPLLYPEVFERFKITPPRGVLFYGPPGTGKTLVARALANECSSSDKKVAFFMRKGADCLSKWVGESERQLRLLFDQAYQMRPSIIFFDEIDGLAPVRSSRQDQIHSSIVSTLLALMDGLDSRGEVVIIGATNRIDAIDPALRRPGRFDREFNFPLPSAKARLQIIKIHTKSWDPQPSPRLVQYLAEQTTGYCGADIKSLCAEAALVALRGKFPQIYSSKQKLLIDVSKINIKLGHFRLAMTKIVPAGQRSTAGVGRRLSSNIQPLLQSSLKRSLNLLRESFPHAFLKSKLSVKSRSAHRPRLLLTGLRTQGQSTHLAPAIVHSLESVPTHKLDLAALYSVSARAPEEACAQVFHEARRNLPSIVYVPHIDQWWGTTSDTLRATFMSLLLDLDPTSPLLLLATSDVPYDDLDEEVQLLFSVYREEVFAMVNPSEEERRQYFKPLFYTSMPQKPKVRTRKRVEDLPLAPAPAHRQLTSKEIRKLEEVEEATLRELRIFLREICAKLARNKTFYIFTKPVDEEEVPDYREIIEEPMDLETMMTKIDQHQYECAQEFLRDIDLICNNALEYNPDKNPEDKIIRHRACTLRDTAYAYIKAEMDTDFEDRCRDIRDNRTERKKIYTDAVQPTVPNFIHVQPKAPTEAVKSGRQSEPVTPHTTRPDVTDQQAKSTGDIHRKRKRRYRSAWSRGEIKPKKKRIIEKDTSEKREVEGENYETKTEEEEEEDTEKLKVEENGEKSDEDISVHSTDNSEEEDKCKDEDKQEPTIQVHVESEVALFNGHLSTEDSHDSMKVTSAADELAAKTSASHIVDVRDGSKEERDDTSQDTTMETEDSVVSSSEQGGGGGPTDNNGVVIDWSHLEAVYESCISATEDATVDDLQRLHSAITTLVHKNIGNPNKIQLLQDTEVEIRRFTQFHKTT